MVRKIGFCPYCGSLLETISINSFKKIDVKKRCPKCRMVFDNSPNVGWRGRRML